ncbi:replication-associated recombination protein A [Lentisphaerota bacterium WC36G]|nr:replication-associated recombination protein A [Lentisphaerae bacterium WC36]
MDLMEQQNFSIDSENNIAYDNAETNSSIVDENNSAHDKIADASEIDLRIPLAARLRPRNFDEYVGQRHLLGEGKLLRRAVDADRFNSIILYGPPGIGKTSLAELIAKQTKSCFVRLSGVSSTVNDIRKEVAKAIEVERVFKRKTILFIDEIHRFNKAQQDVLLPDVEHGTVRLIGATTHNPHFYVIGPLLSRSLVFALEELNADDIKFLLKRACLDERGFPHNNVEITDEAIEFFANICQGDGRKALTSLEIAVLTTNVNGDGVVKVDLAAAEESIQKRAINYGDDGHYDSISAFIKSMRGSDPDAAVYWLAKMLHANEDIRFIARRMVIFASEDIGNADPQALVIATTTMTAIENIGMPEARIILSQAAIYCATAPKSNASYMAIDTALTDVKQNRVAPVPKHLRDAHYSGAKKLGHGEGYKYPHDYENNFVVQDYMGFEKKYYNPKGFGFEKNIRKRLDYWQNLRDIEK